MKDGFTETEVADAKRALLQARRIARAQDASLAGGLVQQAYLGRTWEFAAKIDAGIAAVTVERVNAALRKYVDADGFAWSYAGDFARRSELSSWRSVRHSRRSTPALTRRAGYTSRPLEDASLAARPRADARRRRRLGLHVRPDQGGAHRGAAVHARGAALLPRGGADGVLRPPAGDAVARRRRLRARDRRLPVRPAVPRASSSGCRRDCPRSSSSCRCSSRSASPSRSRATASTGTTWSARRSPLPEWSCSRSTSSRAGSPAPSIGFALVIAAAFAWAAGNIIAKRGAGAHGADMFALTVWSSLVPPLPLAALGYAFEGGSEIVDAVAGDEPARVGLRAVDVLGRDAVRLRLVERAAAPLSAALISPFALLIPVSGLASGALFLGESLAPVQLPASRWSSPAWSTTSTGLAQGARRSRPRSQALIAQHLAHFHWVK